MWDITCKHSTRKKLLILYLKPLPKTSDEKLPDSKGHWVRLCHHWQLQMPTNKFQNSVNSSSMHRWHATLFYEYWAYWRNWFGHQLLAKVCCVRGSQVANLVDSYAVAVPFLLTVTLLWQHKLCYRLKILE